jgi:hypothetical protein
MGLRLYLLILCFSCSTFPALLDTANLGDNTWVNQSGTDYVLSCNGSNWAYENDFKGDPWFGYFVLGPGHKVHPQDCHYYPYDPMINKWYETNPCNKQPRQCLSAFSISSQDSVILQIGGAEGSHQLSQGGWADDYKSIIYTRGRGVGMWVYSLNRNEWYQMKGPTSSPGSTFSYWHEYDPVHDILVGPNNIYNFHYNTAISIPSQSGIHTFYYSCAMDTKRGLYYAWCSAGLYYYNPETNAWSTAPGTPPAHPDGPDNGNGFGLNVLAYDEHHDVLLALSDDATAGGPPNVSTWVYHCDTQNWEQMLPAAAPQDQGRLAYNKTLNMFMLVGGTVVGTISRGGNTDGIWFYRYKHGNSILDPLAAAPKAALDLSGGTAKLSWTRVTESGVTGYNIYRGSAVSFPKDFAKLNGSPATDTFYTDASAVSGTPYSYRVCAVKNSVDGKLSQHLYTRPYRVLNVAASVENAALVRVSWDPNPEPDILGYNVYRATGAAMYSTPLASNYTKLNGSLVNALTYDDGSVDLSDGIARAYVVTAVNAFGLESGVSPECTTFPPAPEWAYTIPPNTLRWKAPRRTKIIGVNYYKYPDNKQNLLGLITDSVTTWTAPIISGGEGYELLFTTYYARSVNVLNQEGFMTDQISSINNEFGTGQVFPVGNRFNYSQWTRNAVSVEEAQTDEDGVLPALSVFPNPFNPTLYASFYLVPAQKVALELFDMAGRKVAGRDAFLGHGRHVEAFDLSNCGSGLYLVRLRMNGKVMQTKAVLVK